jgi:hypothetical protein
MIATVDSSAGTTGPSSNEAAVTLANAVRFASTSYAGATRAIHHVRNRDKDLHANVTGNKRRTIPAPSRYVTHAMRIARAIGERESQHQHAQTRDRGIATEQAQTVVAADALATGVTHGL